jgi:hypothetical protein
MSGANRAVQKIPHDEVLDAAIEAHMREVGNFGSSSARSVILAEIMVRDAGPALSS